MKKLLITFMIAFLTTFGMLNINATNTSTHDFFGDNSALATFQFDNSLVDLGGTYTATANNISYSTGQFNQSVNLSANNALIDTGIPQTDLQNGFSISYWVYFNSLSTNMGVFGDHNDQGVNPQGIIGHQLFNNRPVFGLGDGDFNVLTITPTQQTQVWDHYVMTFNGSSFSVYKNNVFQGTVNSGFVPNSNNLLIGRTYDLSNRYLDGLVDQYRVFDRSLSSTEVSQLYNEDLPTINYPLSVNIDSNYGDYLDTPIQYQDDDEQIQDYPVSATIDSSSDSFTLTAPNTIDDYTFSHWFNLDTNQIESSNNPLFRGGITEPVNLRAIYTGVTNYDIDLNMESGVSGNILYETDTYSNSTIGTIEINAPVIDEIVPEGINFLAEAPELTGYTFDGWFDTSDNSLFTTDRLLTFNTSPFGFVQEITRDWTYEARYTEIPTYTFFANSDLPSPPDFEYEINGGGSLFDYPVDITVNEGDDVYITAPTTNIGFYEFDGWFDNNTNQFISSNATLFIYENIQQDISIQASYSLPPEYDINLTLLTQIGNIAYQVNGGTAIFASEIIDTLYEGQSFIAEAPSDANYRFDGWFDIQNNVLFTTSLELNEQNISRDYILEAQYSEEFTVTFDTNGGTAVNDINVYDGDTINEPLTTRDGFYLQGWNDLSTQFELISFPYTITQDTTLQAQWAPLYTITFNSNGGSPVDPIIVSGGAIASEPNPPSKFGYLFQGWFTDNQTFQNEYDFDTQVFDDIVLHADWELGSDSDISETLNTWIINSNISSMFIVLVVLIAISVTLGIIGAKMFVILISNLSLIFVFTALGFIPLWIVLVSGLAVIGFIIMMVFGGNNNG